MKPIEPLPLYHSWPMAQSGQRFDGGLVHDCAGPGRADGIVGWWACDLADQALTWSAEIYAIFGLPRDAPASRGETVALYAEGSRAAMERLRHHAIKHRRGFTLDAEIRRIGGTNAWMRLIAAPLCDGRRVVRLHGLKQDVSHLYR